MTLREARQNKKSFLFKFVESDIYFFIFEYDEETDWIVDVENGGISPTNINSPFYEKNIILCDVVKK